MFENVPVRRQSRAETRYFSKGQNSVDFTLFAMCALSHNAPCFPPSPPSPPKKKTNRKNISWHCLQFSWDNCNPRTMKNFRLCNILGGKQGVLWEMCKCSVAKPFLVCLAWVAGVRKKRGRELGREGGGRRGTPARKPLFSPSRPLIKKITKITQLWMNSCQVSLAAMHVF